MRPTVLALLVASSTAIAEERPLVTTYLRWERAPDAEGCIGRDQIMSAVESRLGKRAFGIETASALIIDAHLEAAPGRGWRASITTSRADGTKLGNRELTSEPADCHRFDAALILVIALSIEAATAEASAAPPPRPPPQATEAPIVQKPSEGETTPAGVVSATARSKTWQFGAELSGMVGTRVVPTPSFGLAFGASARRRSWPEIEIAGTISRGQELSGDERGVTIVLATAGPGVCPTLLRSNAISVNGCAGIQVGWLRASGVNLDDNDTAAQPIGLASAAVRVDVVLVAGLTLRARAGLWIPFDRPRFFYLDADGSEQDTFQVAAIGGVLGLGVAAVF